MGRKRLARSELDQIDSDYLCEFCHEPLYNDLESKKEICGNENCITYPIEIKFLKSTDSFIDEYKERYLTIVEKFYKFSKKFSSQKLYQLRRDAIQDYFEGNGLPINKMLGIDYLFTFLHDKQSEGKIADENSFLEILDKFVERFDELTFVEEVIDGNYKMTSENKVYILKYLDKIIEVNKVLGIVNKNKVKPEEVNSFYFIDKQVRVGKPEHPHDFTVLFQNHFNLSIVSNHLFKYRYFISQFHNYPGKTNDFVTLLSLWAKCEPRKSYTINDKGLREIYEESKKINKLPGNYEEFLKKYASGKENAPVIIFDGINYSFDYFTLFLFLFYIFSLNKDVEGSQKISGLQILDKQRKLASSVFEETIRECLRKKMWKVFPQNNHDRLILKFDNEEFEFDCIAINENKKKIYLIEIKYEDLPPSSTIAQNLVPQEILDIKSGIASHAKRQNRRKLFFKKNIEAISNKLNISNNFQISSMVVTKHVPLIKKYRGTFVLSYNQFLDFFNDSE